MMLTRGGTVVPVPYFDRLPGNTTFNPARAEGANILSAHGLRGKCK